MIKHALGLIEVMGKLAAVEAADVALKAANVTLLGIENATGALITVKLTGDVGAVKAAVDAARIAASRVGIVIATHVLPRPAQGIYPLMTVETLTAGDELPVMVAEEPVSPECAEEALLLEVEEMDLAAIPILIPTPEAAAPPEEETELVAVPIPEAAAMPEKEVEEQGPLYLSAEKKVETDKRAICNICHDPACPREKGQPVKLCIHA